MISDDSGSESSAGTRSGRARRLRRALSRTPGALPRRTVVSERAAARHAPRAPGVATPVPRRRVFPPLAASGLEERGGAAGTAGLGLASAQPHRTAPPSGPSTWATHGAPGRTAMQRPPVASGPGWHQSFWQRGGGGDPGQAAAATGPRGGRAGARNCSAGDGHRCVQGGNRSPGCERGERRPWHGGGCAPGPTFRARGPIFELWGRTVYFALQIRITYKARGRGTYTFVFPQDPSSLSLLLKW